jgi:hypothetical protein
MTRERSLFATKTQPRTAEWESPARKCRVAVENDGVPQGRHAWHFSVVRCGGWLSTSPSPRSVLLNPRPLDYEGASHQSVGCLTRLTY